MTSLEVLVIWEFLISPTYHRYKEIYAFLDLIGRGTVNQVKSILVSILLHDGFQC